MKLAIWLITLILLVSTVSALGVIPSSKEVTYEPAKVETIELLVKNNEHKDFSAVVYVEGELSDYITIQQQLIEVSSSEDSRKIVLTMKMPESMDKQGVVSSNIVIREVAKPGQSAVSAYLAVSSKLKLRVPYSGKYAEVKLLTPDFIKGKQSNFAVEVNNYGDQDIEEAQAFVDIVGPLNNKIVTLTGEKKRINSKEKALLIVKWVPDLNNGPYRAVATVIYDGITASDEKEFSIGEPTLTIDSISVADFTLGGIAKFDILVSSNWGLPLNDVYGTVKVNDGQTTYTSYKTASLDIEPYSKQLFQAFWDTQKVAAGNYKLDILFNYLDKTSQNVYDIVVKPNEISIPTVGMAATEVETETKTSIKVLAIIITLVLIVTIFNTYVLWKRLKR